MATTRPSGRVEPLSNPAAQWAQQISDWPVPGRFAFFVFKIPISYDCSDWFPGLEQFWDKDTLFVGGTVDKWDSATYALLNRDSPHDCCAIYRFVYTTLTEFGFSMRGERTSQAKKFYLS